METSLLLPPLTSHSLVVLWTELAALLVLARLLGALAQRLRQPAVAGELIAGLLLGPSVLGRLAPGALHWLLPPGHAHGDLLTTVSQVALLVVLVVVGAETDLRLIGSLGAAASWASLASLAIPLGVGVAAAEALPAGFQAGHHPVPFVLLVAGAVGISSLPVVARIMSDLGLLRRTFAQLAMAAGTANDLVGFLLITAATGLAAAGSASRLAIALGGLAVALLAVLTVGQWAIDAVLRQVRRHGPNVSGSLTVGFAAAFAAAAGCQALGLEGALGGFLAGIALGRSRFQQGAAMDQLRRFSNAVMAPLFFATAGLRVDLGALAHPGLAVATAALVVVAFAAKFVAGLVGARLGRLPWLDGAALGVALNGRGTMQVIIAQAGLAAGLFTAAAYSSVIVLALVSSLAVAPLLSAVAGGWRGTEDEQARLDEEARLGSNLVVRDGRLLLAAGRSPNAVVAAAVLHRAWPAQQPVTVLAVHSGAEGDAEERGRGVSWMFPDRDVERKHVDSPDVLEAILAEARLGYAVLGLGAADVPGPDRLLSSVLDEVMVRCPLPMVIARRARRLEPAIPGRSGPSAPGRRDGAALPAAAATVATVATAAPAAPERAAGEDIAFSRILVPVAGTAASRAAQEVAFGLAADRRSRVTLAHVVTRRGEAADAAPPADGEPEAPPASPVGAAARPIRPARQAADSVLRDAERFAVRHGVRARCIRRQAPTPGEEIVRMAGEVEADVIVLGATARSLEGRPFLGHTVEHVLADASAAVVVVLLPADVPGPAAQPAGRD